MTFFYRNRLIERKFKHVFFVPPCQLMITFESIEGTPDEHVVLDRSEVLSILNSILELIP